MKKDAAVLILKYLENKCSRDDLEAIIGLIGRDNEGELQTLLYEFWKNTPSFRHRIAEEELNQILDSVHHRINLHERNGKSVVKRLTYYAIRVAAALFVPLLIAGIWILINNDAYHHGDTFITLETRPGSTLKTVLPDGTEVWQNAGTTLRYPAKFTRQHRQVILAGEAYFHVSSDIKNPFYVKTTDGTIKVTGTKFNVTAFPDDNFSSVVLEEGKVSYIPAGKEKPVMLLPREQIIYRKGSGKLIRQKTDVEKYTSWTKGKLIFRDDPLSEILVRLQRWFNAEIILSDPEKRIGSLTFTMTVKNETLPQVLEYLSQAANLSFSRQHAGSGPGSGPEKTKYILSVQTTHK